MSRWCRIAPAVAAVVAGLVTRPAAASGPGPVAASGAGCPASHRARAQSLIRMAHDRLDRGEAPLAVEHARGAAALCPEPLFRYELGRVYDAAQRPEEALLAFQACVEGGATGELGERCEAEVNRILSHKPAGTMVLVSNDADAQAFVDGSDAGIAVGVPVKLSPGSHRVEVRSSTGRSLLLDVLIESGGLTNVTTDLAIVAAAPAPSGGPAVSVSAPGQRTAAWNWAGVAVGGAMVAGGAVFLAQHVIDVLAQEGAIYDEKGKLLKEADTVGPLNLAVGCALAGAGAALVVTSAVLWPKSSGRAAIVPYDGGAGVAWSMRW
ncbi:MAG: hypothetical protein FJ087_17845 [Deltaproteobacteria bacterium]|nr:hypothetical protein [Deltaproteobacteria bacterium]